MHTNCHENIEKMSLLNNQQQDFVIDIDMDKNEFNFESEEDCVDFYIRLEASILREKYFPSSSSTKGGKIPGENSNT